MTAEQAAAVLAGGGLFLMTLALIGFIHRPRQSRRPRHRDEDT